MERFPIGNTNLMYETRDWGYVIFEYTFPAPLGTVVRNDRGYIVSLLPKDGTGLIVERFHDWNTVLTYLTVNAGYVETRDYGYAVLPCSFWDTLIVYRAYVLPQGELRYDVGVHSFLAYSDEDKNRVRRALTGEQCREVARYWEVFVLDGTDNAVLLQSLLDEVNS